MGTEQRSNEKPRMRVVGATAIALAASMAIQNAMFAWTGPPAYGDPIEEVLAWHAENRVTVAIAVGQEALHLPLLLGFVTGLHGLVGRRGGAGADWSRLAVAAGATLSAVLALYAVLWDRSRAVRRRARRAEPGVRARLAAACSSVRAGAAGARHHLHRRGAGGARERPDSGLAAPAGPGGREPAARRRGGQPRDRGRLGAPVRGAARLLRLARVAACDRRTAGARSNSRPS